MSEENQTEENQTIVKIETNMATLRKIIDEIGAVNDEAKFRFMRTGIGVNVVDPAHVLMLEMAIPNTTLDKYWTDMNAERIHEIGLDIDKLKALYEGLPKSKWAATPVSIELTERRITTEVAGAIRESDTVDTANMPDPKIPTLNLSHAAEVSADEVLDAIKSCKKISQHLGIDIEPEGVTVHTFGKDSSKFRKTLESKHRKGEGTAKSLYSIDYLENIFRTLAGEEVVIQLSSDYPIVISHDHGRFLMAPRLEA
ncbi:MAG: hypothetical protein ABIF09_11335 [Gemmatimonadota bacterium]